ncbi:MAG: DNA mismatch repair protein MutS [Myxococcota bacterium]
MSERSEPGGGDPGAEYAHRLARARSHAERLRAQERWISQLRLTVFGIGLLAGWLIFGTHTLSMGWLAPVVLLFLALVLVHDRVIGKRRRAERRMSFYEDGLARIEGRFTGREERGEAYREDDHPYADDLDLFGEASLFARLCTARTAAGEETLAEWLKRPAQSDQVRARQGAIEELRARLDLREDLALLGEEVRSRFEPGAMLRWGAEPARSRSPTPRIAAGLFAIANGAALLAWIFTEVGALPLGISLTMAAGLAARLRGRVREIIRGVDRPARDLGLLRELLARLEREPAETPRLVALRAAFDTGGRPPSRRIAELQRLVDLLDARRNQLFAPFGALFLWSTQLALAIESWRIAYGDRLASWLAAAGEFEALCALAGYAYERPADAFPEILDSGRLFDATALGHPLLPEDRCVRNDVRIGDGCRALVVSGSNMSGKSTLLRSIGTNAVLALAGAPVCARRLSLSPLSIGASIRVNDSLQQGTSRFYAEIKRLYQIVELAREPRPVLFLLDEVLHGTNSHDRRIGAEAVVRGLLERGAVGLLTTHDLELAKIADQGQGEVANVHFEDYLEDGEIRFDYRLRSGVVRKSNALELMRAVGLEV